MRSASRIAAMLPLLLTAAQTAPAPQSELQPGQGALCALAIYSVLEEVGRQCFSGKDAEFQALVGESVERLGRYALENSDETPAQLEAFKRQMSGADQPLGSICKGDGYAMYRAVRARPQSIRGEIGKLVAHPGKPSWGTCL